MKYITSVDDEEFNTPEAAMRHIFNYVGSEAIQIKFEEDFELTDNDIDSTSMFREYIEKIFEEANDAFEFDEKDCFTIFGETIKII